MKLSLEHCIALYTIMCRPTIMSRANLEQSSFIDASAFETDETCKLGPKLHFENVNSEVEREQPQQEEFANIKARKIIINEVAA